MRHTNQDALSDHATSTFIDAVTIWVATHPECKTQLSRYQSLVEGHHGTARMASTTVQATFGPPDDYSHGLSVWRTARPVPQWPPGILFVMSFGPLIASYFDSDKFWFWEEGSTACTKGKNWTDNPYPAKTYAHQSWFTAWLGAFLERDPSAMAQLEQGVVAEAALRTQGLEKAIGKPSARLSGLAKAIWDITAVAELADAGLSKTTVVQRRHLQSVCDRLLSDRAGIPPVDRGR